MHLQHSGRKRIWAGHRLKVSHHPLPPEEEASAYLPLSHQVLIGGERLTFHLYLKVVQKNRHGLPELKYLLYAAEGEILDVDSWRSLVKTGIERFYVHRHEVDKVIAYLNNHLLLKAEMPDNFQEKGQLLREHLNFSLVQSFDAPHLGRHVRQMKTTLEQLLPTIMPAPTPWNLLAELLYRDYTIYQHCVNVATLAMAMGLFLKKSQPDCVLLGMAGLYHDLGLTRLDQELVNKREPLTAQEWERLKKHPEMGYQLLQGNPDMPLTALRLVLEHHETADGSGYPQGLPLARQHPLTRILCLAEAYDGLTTHRPYRQAYTPFAALKILQGKTGIQGPAFDPQTFKEFIRFLSLSDR